MNAMAGTFPLDTLPGAPIASGPRNPMLRDAAPGTAAQWRHPAWCVLATEYQADSTAADYADTHGFDARLFMVRRSLPATRARPASSVHEPAFPGYLLIRLAPHDPLHLLRRDSRHGIVGLLHAVGQPDRPALLPDLAMLALLDMAARNAWTGDPMLLGQIDVEGRLVAVPRPAEVAPDLAGETLLIEDHPWLTGMRGECLRSGRDRVTLLLRLLGGEREVTLARGAVRRP